MEWMPIIWLVITIILVIVELETLNLVSIWFAIGAASSMFLSIFLPEQLVLQIVLFLIVSIIVLMLARDIAVKKFKAGSTKTNISSLIGRKVLVTKRIEPFNFGEVKVDGNYWTAKSLTDEIIPENEIVEIIEISGVKLVVRKVNSTIE